MHPIKKARQTQETEDGIGITQKQLAKRIGVDQQHVSKWENGMGVSPEHRKTLVDELDNLGIDDLVEYYSGGEGDGNDGAVVNNTAG